MNFLSKLLIALMISFSCATPSNAWHSKMSMKEKAAWITVGGVAVVVTSPIWVTALVGLGVYKLGSFIKEGFEEKFLGHNGLSRFDENTEFSAEEAAEILTRKKNYEWLKTVSLGISNYQNVLGYDPGLNRLRVFIKSIIDSKDPKNYDIAAILCAFRKEFLPNLESELGLEIFSGWINDFDRTSLVPHNYLDATRRIEMSDQSAKQLFGLLYQTLKTQGISFQSPEIP